MNKYGMASAVILIIIGVILIPTFSVAYPCSMSCVGCESIWELLHDTWAEVTGLLLILFGCMGFLASLT